MKVEVSGETTSHICKKNPMHKDLIRNCKTFHIQSTRIPLEQHKQLKTSKNVSWYILNCLPFAVNIFRKIIPENNLK